MLGNQEARPLANRPYLLRRRARYCPAILCCDTVLRAIESFKTSIERLDRFPQSTSLAKINRWMLKIAVFRRSNCLGRWSGRGIKNAALCPKSASLTKMVQQLRHSHFPACVVCLSPPPNISQGHRGRRGKPYPWQNVKVAVT
ncbi:MULTISPECIES: hypothetical protein [unclassified Microcoleus]|uniref:hypothetical protein n=1 Tax=unclassified Microcoleus TaxID=2642155 RepID=UPI001D28A9C1|nr:MULTISPECIES: hypothetical protein [unclassified Microcoleus]MCC3439282.1 hypothetical protein [Microcoleus sp. PH2017_05_CCC_O_A]MCC3584225.1 hypothetical protein [Microcoleus sp. PH2017_30_WIL_O_A]